MDPNQNITHATLVTLSERIQLREDVPQQLIYRALAWAAAEIFRHQRTIEQIERAIKEGKDR